MPASEIRELALTRVRPSGITRGTAEARVTPYALEAIRQIRAARNIQLESFSTAPASDQQPSARSAMVAPIAQRRPRRNRSRNGPISGAISANGSIVMPRNSAIWPRASSLGTAKNKVPASEMASAASPAALNACSSISR